MNNMLSRKLRLPEITKIEYGGMGFIIMDTPRENTVNEFLRTCESSEVTDVVRVCELLYPEDPFIAKSIKLHDFSYKDGSAPPQYVIDNWLELLKERFHNKSGDCPSKIKPIAVHCLAGLGRAPVLVALALMELGMPKEDVITLIRKKRNGAFNKSQLEYLMNYQSKKRLKKSIFSCFLL